MRTVSLKLLMALGAAAVVGVGITVAVVMSGGGDSTGTIVFIQETVPGGQQGSFTFTGVPTGTISGDSTLVVSDLDPGTYTSTQVDPAPDFDVTRVECDDGDSATPSSGDASTRTAVINLDAGETVTCTYTNAQRGSLVIVGETVPDGVDGSFQFTGSPTGTIPADGTLVVANLPSGTYSSTERDPTPDFDLTRVECDDGDSATPSSGDAATRTAIFNLDPGEMVTCTFTNALRGSLVIVSETVPDDATGSFTFTGVPTGTIGGEGTLVVSNLQPGTYTTTEADPTPDFEVTNVDCDDGASATPSSGDASTRTAIFNLDAGETITCTFTNEQPVSTTTTTLGGGVSGGAGEDGSDSGVFDDDAVNPFVEPDEDFPEFPLPDPGELPPDAGTDLFPLPGAWTSINFAGSVRCGANTLDIPRSPPESGVIELEDGGRTIVGTGLEEGATIRVTAVPGIRGRYTGSFEIVEQGQPLTVDFYWQVVTEEYIVGFQTGAFDSGGVDCTIYRPFELTYSGR